MTELLLRASYHPYTFPEKPYPFVLKGIISLLIQFIRHYVAQLSIGVWNNIAYALELFMELHNVVFFSVTSRISLTDGTM